MSEFYSDCLIFVYQLQLKTIYNLIFIHKPDNAMLLTWDSNNEFATFIKHTLDFDFSAVFCYDFI